MYNNQDLLTINYVLPQEAPSFVKIHTNIIKWQKYLNPIQFSLLTYIISRIHKKKGCAFFSLRTATEDTNICENIIRKELKLLENISLIFVNRSKRNHQYYLKEPQEPKLELIKTYLPKIYDKKIKQIKEKENKNINLNKVQYLNSNTKMAKINKQENQENSTKDLEYDAKVHECAHDPHDPHDKVRITSSHEALKPHKMRTKQKKLNKFIESHNRDYINKFNFKKQANFCCGEKINIFNALVNEGISKNKAAELLESIPSDFDIKEYIKFVYHSLAKEITLRNKAGFLIYSIEYGFVQEYLEIRRKNDKKKKENEEKTYLKEKREKIKKKLNLYINNMWKSLKNEEKEKIRRETKLKNSELLSEFNLKENTMEAFYISYLTEQIVPKYVKDYLDVEYLNQESIDELELYLKKIG